MSLALFGLSGRAQGSAAVDTTRSIRARILDNIEDTLGLTRGTTPEVKASDANVTHRAQATGGGAYTGTVTRRYKARVVTGGESGVATVTVTDDTPTAQRDLWSKQDTSATSTPDDGPVAEVVTSGAAISLGAAGLGATLTLTWTGDLVADDEWHVWVGPYTETIGVVRRDSDGDEPGESWVRMFVPAAGTDEATPIGLHTQEMRVVLQCWIRRDLEPHDAIERMLTGLHRVLRLDPTRGGLAIDSRVEASHGQALQMRTGRSWVEADVVALYRHHEDDPRSPT